MKRSLYLLLILLIGFQFPAEAQILKKIGKAVKKAAVEVLDEELNTTDNSVANPDKEGKDTGILKPKGQAAGGHTSSTSAEMEAKNFFEASTKREVYGEVGDFVELSPDKAFLAHSGFQGTRPAIFINGKPGPEFDDVPESLRFSPEGGHYAYVGKRNGKCIVVIDGKEGEPMDCKEAPITRADFHFNQDGSLLVYSNRPTGYGKQIFINGEPGPEIPILSRPYISGKNVYYAGKDWIPHKNLEALADLPSVKYYKQGSMKVHPVFDRFAYITQEGQKYSLVLDGKKVAGPYDILSRPVLHSSGAVSFAHRSEDRENHSYTEETNVILWKDQTFTLPTGEKLIHEFHVSADGKQFSYYTKGEGGERAWWNGKAGPYYEEIKEPRFSADGKKFLYLALTGGKTFLVLNGEELGPFDQLSPLQFSEKGNAFSFIGKIKTENSRYLNGTDIKFPGDVSHFTFSPNGNRYAYAHEKTLVVNGEEITYPGFEGLVPLFAGENPSVRYRFLFSPDGERLAFSFKRYNEQKKTELVLVLDGQEFRSSFPNKEPFGYPSFSPDGSHFAFLAPVRGENNKLYWRLILDMKPGPIIGEHGKKLGSPGGISLQFRDNKTLVALGNMNNEIVAHTVTLD